jgi:hypothetical protein
MFGRPKVQTWSHAGKESPRNPSQNRGLLQILAMARGNQRDKAREANQKKMADQVGGHSAGPWFDKRGEDLPVLTTPDLYRRKATA